MIFFLENYDRVNYYRMIKMIGLYFEIWCCLIRKRKVVKKWFIMRKNNIIFKKYLSFDILCN